MDYAIPHTTEVQDIKQSYLFMGTADGAADINKTMIGANSGTSNFFKLKSWFASLGGLVLYNVHPSSALVGEGAYVGGVTQASLLQGLQQLLRVLGWDCNQQTTARLRICQYVFGDIANVFVEISVMSRVLQVVHGAARYHTSRCKFPNLGTSSECCAVFVWLE